MSELYKRIEVLCHEHNVTITDMCRESHASRASLTDLKKGRKQTLSVDTLEKIADYFHVSVDSLLGKTVITLTLPDHGLRDFLDSQLSGIDFALSGEIHDLTDNEKQDILDYIRFKKSQRGGGDK